MSTYYKLACEKCREQTSLVRSCFPDRFMLMADAGYDVPLFVKKHEEHLNSLRVISEHDDRYGEYSEFEPSRAEVTYSPNLRIGEDET